MKKSFLILSLPLMLIIFSASAKSPDLVTIKGKFMGANCMFFLKSCPDDMSEGHVKVEPDFVIVEPSGKYYYILNITRRIKARYLHQDVRVKGSFNEKGSFIARTLEVKKDGKYKVKWRPSTKKYAGF